MIKILSAKVNKWMTLDLNLNIYLLHCLYQPNYAYETSKTYLYMVCTVKKCGV